MFKTNILSAVLTRTASEIPAGDTFISFARGWDESQWLPVRSPRWETAGKWQQKNDCISNIIGGDPGSEYDTPAHGSDYASLLYKKQLNGELRLETVCKFEERMAPLLVLSRDIGPVYGEHIEVVLFDLGINVWHHYIKPDGTPDWQLIGFYHRQLKPGKKHKLVAEIHSCVRGSFICVGVDKPSAGIKLPADWEKQYYAGITACEGHNSFYSFRITGVDRSNLIDKMLP